MNADRSHDVPVAGHFLNTQLEPIQVQCPGFRCLAYRAPDGSWMDFLTDRPIERVVGVVRYNLTDFLPD
jgi:hypothetical protein